MLSWQWESSPDPDFAHFNILRSTYNQNSGVFDIPIKIGKTIDFAYIDSAVSNNLLYQYTIQTEDNRGSLRNSISKILNFNLRPPEIQLYADSVSHSEAWLSWDEPMVNNAPIADFQSYVLMRSEYKGLLPDTLNRNLPQSSLIYTGNSPANRFYKDSNLLEGNIYYYRVYVLDIAELSQGSNELELVSNP